MSSLILHLLFAHQTQFVKKMNNVINGESLKNFTKAAKNHNVMLKRESVNQSLPIKTANTKIANFPAKQTTNVKLQNVLEMEKMHTVSKIQSSVTIKRTVLLIAVMKSLDANSNMLSLKNANQVINVKKMMTALT